MSSVSSQVITAEATPEPQANRFERRAWRHWGERLIEAVLFLAAFSAVAVTVAIVAILVTESLAFFEHVPLSEFLTDTQWTIMFADKHYGVLPLLAGTLTTTGVALSLAVPVGTVSAIYLSEFAGHRTREIVKPTLELLAGIPTVVFGYFALLMVTPALQYFMPDLPGFNMLGAGLVMGVMIIPYVSSVAEDAMRAVPMHMREGSYAMGATRLQTAIKVVMPAATSGIVAAYILGISRAIGETMVVAVAAGQQPNFTFDPRESGATITAFIVQVALGDLPHGSLEYQSIFAVGLVLVLMTLFFNVVGHLVRKRFREAY
ncbi:phosphate ABC transporter permease subunit PstC [Immundisolibacter sp.]|uniref:phosphate ABC transporter permease subunit PstC n=1 Tax=Immundisolibacter sp. TaxID=1934948 RepID=UPI00356A9CEA